MTSIVSDPSALRYRLEAWAARAMADVGPVRIDMLARADGGQSSETWLIDARIDDAPVRWVLRIEPRENQIYEDPAVERQFRVVRGLCEHSDLPVPPVLQFEPDETLLGAPFFLMTRANGCAPPNSYHDAGLLTEARPVAREAMWLESIALLARLHTLDPEPFDFLRYGDAEDGITQELARWDSYRSWSGVPSTPLLESTRRWLDDNRPGALPAGFAWGDARPCNILYSGDRPVALLDWETASLGGAETDLGWWIFYDEMMCEGIGVPRLPGIGDRAATIATWEHLTGRRAQAMDWHILFAAWRFVLISERALALAIASRRYPASAAAQGSPAVHRLEQLIRG